METTQTLPAAAALTAFDKAAATYTRKAARIIKVTDNGSISAYVYGAYDLHRAFFPADGSISTWCKVS